MTIRYNNLQLSNAENSDSKTLYFLYPCQIILAIGLDFGYFLNIKSLRKPIIVIVFVNTANKELTIMFVEL